VRVCVDGTVTRTLSSDRTSRLRPLQTEEHGAKQALASLEKVDPMPPVDVGALLRGGASGSQITGEREESSRLDTSRLDRQVADLLPALALDVAVTIGSANDDRDSMDALGRLVEALGLRVTVKLDKSLAIQFAIPSNTSTVGVPQEQMASRSSCCWGPSDFHTRLYIGTPSISRCPVHEEESAFVGTWHEAELLLVCSYGHMP